MAFQIAARPMQAPVIPIRDERYKKFIRGEPCIVRCCRRPDVEFMHTGNRGACKGRKACDLDGLPGCSYHHRTGPRPEAHHSCAEWEWEAFHGLDLAAERVRLRAKYLGLEL